LKTYLNFDDTFIGFLYAFWLISVIPGSIVGGMLADKFGRKIPLYVFLIFMMIFSVTPIIINNFYLLILNFTVLLFFSNGSIAATWALIMDIINPKISCAEHEIICSIVNLGSIAIGSATGTLIVLFGFNNLFLFSAFLIIIALFVLFKIRNLKKINWSLKS
jgi:MFS family permease